MQMYSKPKKKFSCEDEKFDEEVFMLFIWKSKEQIDSPGLEAAALCRHGKNCKISKISKFEIGNRNTSHALVYICIIKPLEKLMVHHKPGQRQQIKQYNQHLSTTGNIQTERQMKNQPSRCCLLKVTCLCTMTEYMPSNALFSLRPSFSLSM